MQVLHIMKGYSNYDATRQHRIGPRGSSSLVQKPHSVKKFHKTYPYPKAYKNWVESNEGGLWQEMGNLY